MKTKNREIFFFIEQYDGNHDREEYHQWKNTRNYMNKFSISEEDSFDIIGIYTINNPSTRDYPNRNDDQYLKRIQNETLTERKKVFEHLAKASGIVHVFISGMLLYTEHEQKRKGTFRNQSYVCLHYIIPKCLSSVIFLKIKTLRISVMEMRIGRRTKPSKGNKIHSNDVNQLYKNEHKMSLNDQLDIFYENCLKDSVRNEVVYIYHAPLLTTNDFFIFQDKYDERQYGLLSFSLFLRTLMKFLRFLL